MPGYNDDEEEELPPHEYPDKWTDDFDDHQHMVLVIVITVLAAVLFTILIIFLYRKFCKNRPVPYSERVGSVAGRLPRYGYPNTVPQWVHYVHRSPPGDYHYDNQTLDVRELDDQFALTNTRRSVQLDGLLSGPVSNTPQGNRPNFQTPNDDLSLVSQDLILFQQFPSAVRDLFVVSERSIRKTVADKLVVAVAHVVDHTGDTLILDNMGISLYIPPGAIAHGEKQVITLVLNWDLSDNPKMSDNQALVSPVVYCGPHGLKLNESCVLNYRHCAYDPGDVQIMVSETDLTGQKDWTTMCDAREEMGRCLVTQEECQVLLDHFSLITSVQSRPGTSPGKKWLQIAVFTSPLQTHVDHYQVRIYFLNKTPCALEWAIQNEAEFGSNKCCPEKVFLFNGNGEDMFLSLAYLSDNWACIDGSEGQRIAFLAIWHGHCPHVSMCFKRDRHSRIRAEEINIHFLAYQDGRDNEHERLVVHMTENRLVSRTDTDRLTPDRPIIREDETPARHALENTYNSFGSENVVSDIRAREHDASRPDSSIGCVELYPEELKRQLMILLDSPTDINWRDLAARLSFDHTPLESLPSPTLFLLQQIEQTGSGRGTLERALREIGRDDAARLVHKSTERTGEEHLYAPSLSSIDSIDGTATGNKTNPGEER